MVVRLYPYHYSLDKDASPETFCKKPEGGGAVPEASFFPAEYHEAQLGGFAGIDIEEAEKPYAFRTDFNAIGKGVGFSEPPPEREP